MKEYEQKQIQAALGTHLPENEATINLMMNIKSIFESAAKRSRNAHNFDELFHYIDLFIDNEQKRSFLLNDLPFSEGDTTKRLFFIHVICKLSGYIFTF